MEGKVTSITKFGAFVALEGGGSGLVHISEVANTFVNDVHDFLQEGQSVKVLVLSEERGRVNLSIKKALPRESGPAGSGRPSGAGRPAGRPSGGGRPSGAGRPAAPRRSFSPQPGTLEPSGDAAFEDKLKRFLSSSEGKMADLNRTMDGRRGRRRK